MTLDEAAKKKALRLIPSGIFVVGTRNPDVKDAAADLNAYIGSWVTQSSFKPPMVVMGVRQGTRGHQMIRDARVFSLNFPRATQKDVAAAFMRDLEAVDGKMAGVAYETAQTGAPIFPSLGAWLDCEVVALHEEGGDHDVVVARVVAAGAAPDVQEMLTTRSSGWSYGG